MSIANNRILSGGVPTTDEAVERLLSRVHQTTFSSASAYVALRNGQHVVKMGELQVNPTGAARRKPK